MFAVFSGGCACAFPALIQHLFSAFFGLILAGDVVDGGDALLEDDLFLEVCERGLP